jgi:hypothetical protein
MNKALARHERPAQGDQARLFGGLPGRQASAAGWAKPTPGDTKP